MSERCKDRDEYVKDKRIACRFGVKCYQKNKLHHEKYKHPPQDKNDNGQGPSKKRRLNVKPNKKANTVDDEKSASENSDKEDNEEDKTIGDMTSDSTSKDEKISNDVSDSDEEDTQKIAEQSPTTLDDQIQDSNNIEKDVIESSPVKNDCLDTNSYSEEKQFIKEKFLVEMPEDFYRFWEFCKTLDSKRPSEALKQVGISLVGPYDVLAGKFKNAKSKSPETYLLHWRYYYDPPEFQTIAKGDDSTGFHIGYFRDSPKDMPVFVANNHGKKDGVISEMGDNIFGAINLYLEKLLKSGDPFKKMHVARVQGPLKKEAAKYKFSLEKKTESMRKRVFKVVTKTFNTAGLVVPYNKKTKLGYRELAAKDNDLKKLLDRVNKASEEQRPKVLSELQPVLTYASIATDECDFGTGIELGLDIFAAGVDCMNSTALRFLANSYRLIDKEEFAKIAEAHLNNRKKGCCVSILYD